MHERLESILNSPITVPLAIGVVSFGSGLGLGFLFGKRKYNMGTIIEFPVPEVDFNTEAEDEEDTQIVRPPRVVIDPEVAEEKGILTVKDLGALRPDMVADSDVEVEVEVEVVEVREEDLISIDQGSHEIYWDWETELAERDESAPYILHREEFYNNEKNYTQISLTYFARDETLADDDNRPIYNVTDLVGDLKFGHGSGDNDLIFVRNNERRAEYEIGRIDGHYMIEVLGLEEEQKAEESDLRHSKDLRFRMV